MTTNRRSKTGEEMKQEVLDALQKFSDPHKALAVRMHALITAANPSLQPRLWYGMPGYAKTKDSAVLCFFREDDYMTFGISEAAQHSVGTDGTLLMPSAWFFTDLNEATEAKISDIVTVATA